MGWEHELTEEEAEEERRHIEEINAACEEALNEPPPEPEPHREGIDWIRTSDGDPRHPLAHRCFESAVKFSHQAPDLGGEGPEGKDLHQFLFEFQTTSVKLGAALNGMARGEGFPVPGLTVACLKRALWHLHQSQAGLEAVAARKRLPETFIAAARTELFEVREGILRIMDQLRGRA